MIAAKPIRNAAININDKLANWRQTHFAGNNFIYVVAIFLGIFCGAAAAALKALVSYVTNSVFSVFSAHQGSFILLVVPIIGIFLAVLISKYITRHQMDHASDRITSAMAKSNNSMSPHLIWGPLVTCSITLGLGGSAGAEDPICYSGAAIGSNIGKMFKVSTEELAQLVGCGAAAGIAGIFMAPIGGVMFAIEVLKMKQSYSTIYAMIISSLIAALTCFLLLGLHTDITFFPDMRFDYHLVPYVLLCGLACGIYSYYYRFVIRYCKKIYAKLNNIWIKAAIGGAILSVMLFFLPSLYGEGYSVLARLMGNDPVSIAYTVPFHSKYIGSIPFILILVVLLAVKPFATSSTNDSGGVGGGFTPTFFAGGVAGFLFAYLLNLCFGMNLPLPLFVYFGMAAVMAGAIKAPLMAMFIASEMTGLYGFILPLTLSAAMSYGVILLFDYMKSGKFSFLREIEFPFHKK